jgi:hypothetical protein
MAPNPINRHRFVVFRSEPIIQDAEPSRHAQPWGRRYAGSRAHQSCDPQAPPKKRRCSSDDHVPSDNLDNVSRYRCINKFILDIGPLRLRNDKITVNRRPGGLLGFPGAAHGRSDAIRKASILTKTFDSLFVGKLEVRQTPCFILRGAAPPPPTTSRGSAPPDPHQNKKNMCIYIYI